MSDSTLNDLPRPLPCPFCGSAAAVIDFERPDDPLEYAVTCTQGSHCELGYFDTPYEAVAAWNTRAEAGNPVSVSPSEMRLLDPNMPEQELRLHMGELTCQEERTARAAIRWANSMTEAKRELIDPQIMSSWVSGDDDTRLLLNRLKLVGKYQRSFDAGASS